MAEKKTTAKTAPAPAVETVENPVNKMIDGLVEKAQAALKEFLTLDQEQIDHIVHEMALAGLDKHQELARMAVEETGRGVYEDKVIKNMFATEYIWHDIKKEKTVGVLDENEMEGYVEVAEPVGVIAGVTPTTNPTSTTLFKSLIAVKTRNPIIFGFHPSAQKCSAEAARIVYEAAVKAGAPENCIQWIDTPSIEATGALMNHPGVATILATGGPGMVKAAYSCGKPALGVGPGNVPCYIEKSADLHRACTDLMMSKTFDNGMICASEQSVTVIDTIYDQVKAEFQKRGCYFVKQGAEMEALRAAMFKNGALDHRIPGMAAAKIAELAGIEVPAKTKILIAEVTSTDPAKEEFSHEKLSPVLAMYHAKDFQEAVDKAEHLVLAGGPGHTASLYVHPAQAEKISLFEHVMKACRIVINTPSSHGGIGDLYNFGMKPSLTLGCGSWGGNSVSENVGVKHLINVKTVAERRENMLWFRAPEKVYFKKGSTPVALDELGNVMGKKRAFIVTDQFLFKNGNTRAIEAKLDEMGIAHDCFYDVEPDPSLQCARRGAKQMALFEPDVIIAVGGGSAMDAGKIMWMMYEHPECKFEDMAMDFMDIRKRIFTFPEMGKKAYFVAVPTSSGTGSECTPFAIITDKETGIKWPLADYALLPNMAIVDADNCMTAPRGLTAASGIDVMTHAIESYVSIMASDYTKGLSERAAKLVFENLPSSFTNGAKDPHAREEMHNASCMAGMAFANAFLGLNHSMAHKLGAFHHLPHGLANAVILTRVMRYNAAEAPVKMGTFSQYPYPNALHNYAEMAKYCGIEGKDDKEVFENFITKLEELKDFIGVKKTIADYGVDEQYFLDTLDEMTEQAFNDQCTGANPRYPLMSEIKELYLDAYYGREPQDYAVC